ncbi:zinc fingers and homeoboxes protein 3 isoform X2 [Monodelphis domestica]|uniref:zinc fingers and homeoboxes protein 3 isoform X2 n=1 Tax=Monodelphis domestica TaxID=13616 RepID=UPI0024E1F8DF|nr:zinc fingers and homeoboxes protein 3 isoform X2 [Monodelphis domestica]XP_007474395.2 zinc fingers and homeoboxes protein 3 isoform X2 [Monodelphis domestica]XP_007474396.2 zinc fingers and homeoboxes protein 3 isoform X2 [Monodelphis domestica]XP_016288649.2 zinc fingers and homeoboxes protein 3 isoform X2 [Monodelphis domestica]XP_056667888.1 zinc fingers and homeoboxes protein 3 isoform X2 [Monodelphis domestica]XP_056667889.1 zinc fingers and homeoboxes protein 3 isoform X2 [Monodelphi
MASKRKSTTPCMIPVKTVVLQETEADPVEGFNEGTQQELPPETPSVNDAVNNNNNNNGTLSNGHRNTFDGDSYVCKYCDFGSQDMNQFMGHMNSEHTDFNKDPTFVCIECSFMAKTSEGLSLHNAKCHTGEISFIWNVAKQDNHITVEQIISDSTSSHDLSGESYEEGIDGQAEIIITKTPIMKIMKGKAEAKKIHTLKENLPNSSVGENLLSQPAGDNLVSQSVGETDVKESDHSFTNGSVPVSQATSNPVKTSHVANGPLIGTVPVLPAGIAQFLSIQQQPQVHAQHHHHQPLPTSKSLPKVMIPLSSIPTYNAAMDSNSFLKNSFHKFPYPTKAELCYLTVVTKYPEEQLKIWFTAQRLKQGISWSPEEIEDARKKMFNTVIQSVPQPTITVLNTPLVANAGNVQHLIQAALPGHVVTGQPEGTGGLLVTQPIMANGLQGTSSSLTLAVTSVPKQPAVAPHNTVCSNTASTVKVVNAAQSLLTACPTITSQAFLDSSIYKNKKSHEQLSALKGSFCRNQFPGQGEVEHLTKITGLTTREVRKWFSDRRYHCRNLKGTRSMLPGDNSSMIMDSAPDVTFTLSPKAPDLACVTTATTPGVHHSAKRQSWHQTPDFTPTKYKERAPEQIRALESSFAQNPIPLEEEVDRLRSETKMTRREIDSWFSERRKKKSAEENKKSEEAASQEEEEVEEDCGEEDPADEWRVSSENGSSEAPGGDQPRVERKVSPIKINLKNLRVTEANGRNESLGLSANDHEEEQGLNKSLEQPKNKVNYKKTAQQRHLLRQLFVQTQWPTNQEYDGLVSQSGLPRAEVVRWFGDSRYALKNGQLKWYEDYKHGNFPPGLLVISPSNRELLQDYYKTHKTLYEDDLQSLCDKTQMSSQQVKLWFAEKMGEETRAVSDTCSEDQYSSTGEQAGNPKGTGDTYSEVSENSESWEPSGQEISSEPFDTLSPQAGIQLEAD